MGAEEGEKRPRISGRMGVLLPPPVPAESVPRVPKPVAPPAHTSRVMLVFDCGRVLFGSRVAKREAEGTVHTKHQLNLDPNPEGT